MEKILEERIKLNAEIFNVREVETILHDISIFAKIYLLGIVDAKKIEI